MTVLTLAVNCDQTFFLNESNSPFFLIVCSKLSIDERCIAFKGRSDVRSFFRCGGNVSSDSDLLATAISDGIVLIQQGYVTV